MNIAIIGLGVISKYYLKALKGNLSNQYTIKAICDLKPTKLTDFQNEAIYSTTNYKNLLSLTSIDAVIINTPNNSHYEICKAFLGVGKHVCCEKPLCIDQNHASKLVELSKQVDKRLFTAFHRRYNVNYRKIVQFVKSEYSQLVSIVLNYNEKIEDHAGTDTWYLDLERCGGGCIADNGSNAFDAISALLGPLNVEKSKIVKKNKIAEINAKIEMTNKDNIKIFVNLDWDYPDGEQKEIIVNLKSGKNVTMNFLQGFSEFKSSLYHEYEEVLKDFHKNVNSGRGNGEEGLNAVLLVNEAYRNAGLG